MIQIVIEIEVTPDGDMMLQSQAYPHPPIDSAEVKVGLELRRIIQEHLSKAAKSAHISVEAAGPNAKEICESVAKQYHRENPRS